MLRFSLLTLLALFPAATLAAQETDALSLQALSANDIEVEGLVRFRGIRRSGDALFTSDNPHQAEVLARVGLTTNWDAYLSGYLELDAVAVDAGDAAEMRLRRGWVDINKLWLDSSMRVGRFDIAFGDERIASSASWWAETNAFDGILLDGSGGNMDWSLWASEARQSVVALGGEGFHGGRVAWELPEMELETYAVQLHNGSALSEWTYGLRAAGETYLGLNWNVHGAMQYGNRGDLRIVANAFAADFDYELDGGHHIGLTWQRASGSEEDGDDRDERFHAPFGDGMRHFGRVALGTWSNISAWALRYRLDWNQRWAMHADFHTFSRDSSDDAFRLGSRAEDSRVADEIDFYLRGNLTERLDLDFGFTLLRASQDVSNDSTQTMFWLLTGLRF